MTYFFYFGLSILVLGITWATPCYSYWQTPVQTWPHLLIAHSIISVSIIFLGLTITVGEWWRDRQYKAWFSKYSRQDLLQRMPWEDFEKLVGAAFKFWGFKVQSMGGAKADGGIDLIVQKNGQRHMVQCKRYKNSVGVPIVREMFGVMVSEGFDGVYILTSGKFTKECFKFAEGKPIKLIAGDLLANILEEADRKLKH